MSERIVVLPPASWAQGAADLLERASYLRSMNAEEAAMVEKAIADHLAGRAVQDDGLPPGLDVEKLHAETHDPEWQAQDGCHDAVQRLLAALSELHQHARTQPHGSDCDRDNCYVMAAPHPVSESGQPPEASDE